MNREILLSILDLARWAPSGDNTQPWRFEIVSDFHVAIHGNDTRDHVVYDFDGRPSQLAHGALLETLRLAATRFGLATQWELRQGCPEEHPIYDVRLSSAGIPEDPLVEVITKRCVQRRPMRTTPLSSQQRQALIAAVGNDFTLKFFESFNDRLKMARLLWDNAHIRLICPEAYCVHRDVIEWRAQFSTDRIPDRAVGVDPLTTYLMRWVMQRWERVDFFNRYLFGTIPPRIQLDLLPALACAGHVLIQAKRRPERIEDFVAAGMSMQRLWLTVASEGLYLQPEMTPIIFRWYANSGRAISASQRINRDAADLTRQLESLAGVGNNDGLIFLCRVGNSNAPAARSLRRGLSELLVGSNTD